MDTFAPELLKVLEIIWVNIVLSGDNAVVIAMACRGLPKDKQRVGMVLGAGVAVVLRIVFTIVIASLLATPFLKIAGGLLLLWVAVKLVADDEDESNVKESDKLWKAVRTVAVADAVMSLDNVLAIAAVAEGSTVLLILGLAISIPLIVAGASFIINLLERFTVLVWAGAGLLGWIAGDMISSDPALVERVGQARAATFHLPAAAFGVVVVIGLGYLLSRRSAESRA